MVFHLPKDKRKLALAAGIIGNVIEWYDFALYGYMTVIISSLFFPDNTQALGLLATYGIFAAGFLMRPLGATVFGWLGDTIGRSRTMLISVIMMMISTFVLGLLPTYTSIGAFAAILLVLIRLLQGLSVGGEFSSSVTYLVETAPLSLRGLSGSWANAGSGAGMLLGALLASLATNLLSDSALLAWGWRLPFLFGGILGSSAILLRRKLPESPQFLQHEQSRLKSSPIKEAFSQNRKETLQGMLFASGYGAIFYLTMVYLPTWLYVYNGLPLKEAMKINVGGTFLVMVLIPLMGWISDRFIRRTHFISISMALFAILSIPLLNWTKSGSTVSILVTQVVFAMLVAVPAGAAPAMFTELFPTRDRLSGYSISFNVGMGMIGGSTPMIVSWLIQLSGNPLVPGFYIFGWALMCLAALTWIKDRSREPLL